MFKRVLRWISLGLIAAVVLVSAAYFWDINQAYERVHDRSTVIPSPYGDIEYTEGGSGPAVLVIHGSGGYDQGELLARAVLGEQFHWITPSRFGYLRSTFHEGATFDDQAHAYAYLLDQLGIKKVAVVAISHGCPSALLFAVLPAGAVAEEQRSGVPRVISFPYQLRCLFGFVAFRPFEYNVETQLYFK